MKKFLALYSFATFLSVVSGLSAFQKFEADKDQSIELHSRVFDTTITNASVSPLSGRLVLNSKDSVTLYDFTDYTQRPLFDEPRKLSNPIINFVISPSGQEIAYTSLKSVFSFSNGKGGVSFAIERPEGQAITEYLRFNNTCNGIFTFAGSGSKDSCIIALWDIETKKPRFLKDLKDEQHCSSVLSAAFSHDDTKLATTSVSGTVKIWDATEAKPLRNLVVSSQGELVKSAEFDSIGTKIVTASNDKLIKIWDVQTGECLTMIEGHEGPVNFAMFCAHENLILSCSNDKSLKVWDAFTHELYVTFNFEDPVKSACFMADGKALIVQLMLKGTSYKEVQAIGALDKVTRELKKFDKSLFAYLALNQDKVKTFTSAID